MGVVYGVDVGDDLGVRSTAASYDDYAGNEPQGVAGIADAVAPVGDYSDVVPLPAYAIGRTDAALDVVPATVRDSRTTDSRYALFNVDPYVPLSGKPRALGGTTGRIEVSMTVGGLRELETYPDPASVAMDSQARWLPETARYPANLQWFPFSAAGQVDQLIEGGQSWQGLTEASWGDLLTQPWLAYSGAAAITSGALGDLSWYSSSGAPPKIVTNYTYLRGGSFVVGSAMSLRKGQFLYSDTLTLETSQITVVLAAVLRVPQGSWYTVLESTSSSPTQGPVSVRYHREGVLVLWCDEALATIPVQAGLTRPNQPILVSLTIDFDSSEVTMCAVDSATHVTTVRLQERPSIQPRLYLGRSEDTGANSVMEILEADLWTTVLTSQGVVDRMGRLDRLYGVSSS